MQAEDAFRLIYAERSPSLLTTRARTTSPPPSAAFLSRPASRTFRAALARCEDGEPVGMAYGYPARSRHGLVGRTDRARARDMRREDGHRTFGLMELAVRGPWRGQGIARRLHETLLDGIEPSGCC